ncbi:MAG: MBL fold metallo-hydrolase [Fuerstiella sp.]|nr:MBL fold metallo-hydrolase [Fuerstiella sp.]
MTSTVTSTMKPHTPFPITTLQIPNPFFEGRNCVYVIHSDPLTVIDTGVATEKARTELRNSLKAENIAVEDIGRIVLTHKHIDHVGNAWWLQKESGAEIMIHEIESGAISDVDPEGRRWRTLVTERFESWNVPKETTTETRNVKWDIRPARPTAITGGQQINLGGTALEVIHTPGHTMGSICLRLDRVMFAGDHILPDVSPNIGGGDLIHQGLLNEFLTSLRRCRQLSSDIDLVLPGHGAAFEDLQARCQTLYDHHQQRLDDVMSILRRQGPLNVYTVATELFGDIANIHVVLGCAEAQAHLEHLVLEGRATCNGDVYMVA